MHCDTNHSKYTSVFGRLIPDEVEINVVPETRVRKDELIGNYLEISKSCLYQAIVHLTKNKSTKSLTKKLDGLIDEINDFRRHNRI